MYIEKLELENTGPIDHLTITFPFNNDGSPKPIILVGQNGAGKSIVLAHIVNSLLSLKQTAYPHDGEVESGKVYKLRSPSYIKHGRDYSKSEILFQDGIYQTEIQLSRNKDEFEKNNNYTPIYRFWRQIDINSNSHITDNFSENSSKIELNIDSNSILYFPPNRFEEPAWLNYDNLTNKASYLFAKSVRGRTHRNIINYAPMRENHDWLLDILYDANAIEKKVLPIAGQLGHHIIQAGPATSIFSAIQDFLRILFNFNGNLTTNVGRRGQRRISLIGPNGPIANNLFGLSTGESLILNIFLTIIRDYDYSRSNFNSLSEIKGIVVIDEIDIHLHSNLQHDILPRIIALFPRVQFILTSHSPLFLLGMSQKLGGDNISIVNLPDGSEITVERFAEFEQAYSYFKESTAHELEIKNKISESKGPILFVEGDIDKAYIEAAANILNRRASIEKFHVFDANGYGGLDKIWCHFNTKLADATHQSVVLLYDCDKPRNAETKGSIFRRTIPKTASPIDSGIENLFSAATIDAASAHRGEFIDITEAYDKKVRGTVIPVEKKMAVNPDEKRNLSTYLIENATSDMFANFGALFDLLDQIPV